MPRPSDQDGTELAAIRDDAFRRFASAPRDPNSPFRTPVMATVAAPAEPRLRTVVLRGFDPIGRLLTVHTDARAAKVGELRLNPRVSILVWDAPDQVQVQLSGSAATHGQDAVAEAAWKSLPEGTRATYAVAPAPGMPLPTPDGYSRGVASAATMGNFAVVVVTIDAMDWLSLAGPKHRRAKFTWRGGQEQATWVVP